MGRLGVRVLGAFALIGLIGCGGHDSSSRSVGSVASPSTVGSLAITGVMPPSGPATGGTAVELQGAGFLPGATVTFGTVSATGVVVHGESRITCATPPGTVGSVDVTVSSGGSSVTLPGAFGYAPNLPALTRVTPSNGPQAGGTVVNLTGSGFASGGTPVVTFGGLPGTRVTVLHDAALVCETPVGAASGSVDVQVRVGVGSATLPNGWSWDPPPSQPLPGPTLASVSPDWGSDTGGDQVVVRGTGFTNGSLPRVDFGASSATNVVVVSDTELSLTTPAHAAGVVSVTVTSSRGTASLPNAFSYLIPPPITPPVTSPQLQGVLPNEGPTTGDTQVTVLGSGFLRGGAVTVELGGVSATQIVVVDDRRITCRTPASATSGPVNLTVRNANGGITMPAAFTYHEPPVINVVLPNVGPQTGGTRIVLFGRGFQQGTPTVTFGGVPAPIVIVISDVELGVDTPPHAPGTVDVTVSTPFGSDTELASFFFSSAPPSLPTHTTLAAVSPDQGSVLGGTRVTLTGTGFQQGGAPDVRFGADLATNVTVLSDTQLTATTPPGSAGPVAVTFTSSWGNATLPNGFTYQPTTQLSVTAVTPDRGSTTGGVTVTVQGAGFTGGGAVTVTLGGVAATQVVVLSDSLLTAVTPAGTAGAVDLVIQNRNGQATLAAGFTYRTPGTLTLIAGTGSAGYLDGPALRAQFNDLSDVAVDARGNLFVADSYNHRIRKIDPSGWVTTVAGTGPQGSGQGGFSGDGGPAVNARLEYPNHLGFDPAGNLWVMDGLNNRLRRLALDPTTGEVGPNSTIDTFVGKGPNRSFVGAFSGDGGLAVDAELGFPKAFCFDPAGNLLIADRMNNRIRKVWADPATSAITKQSRIDTIAGSGTFGLISGGYSGDGGPATQAELNKPMGIACDASGVIYVSDTMNNVVRKIDPSGTITTVVGVASGNGSFAGDGGLANQASLFNPWGLAIDRAGNLFISDDGNRRVRKVTAVGGAISDANGARIDSLSGFSQNNRALTFRPNGDLLIAGGAAHRLTEVTVP